MHSKHPPAKVPQTTDLHIFLALRVRVIRIQLLTQHRYSTKPTADIISSRMCDTTTLLVIPHKTPPIPIVQSPGFLPNGINLHTSNASNDDRCSVVQSFFTTSANVLHKSFELLQN